MSEVAPTGGGPNRLFIVLLLGLGGLLIIGLVGLLAFVFVIQPMMRPAAAAPTPPRVVVTVATPTRAPTATPTLTPSPTNTLAPTATFVVQPPAGGAVTPAVTVTATPGQATVTPTPTAGMPNTGIGENLLLLAGGIVLVLIIYTARRARTGTAI